MAPSVFLAFFLAAVSPKAAGLNSTGPGWNVPPYVILPASDAAEVLHQCSRPTIAPADGFWTPTKGQVKRLERLLPGYLARARGDKPSAKLRHYFRQYVGVVSEGQHLIYGNFLAEWIARRMNGGGRPTWRTTPFVICDGGDDFWGIAFDVESATFREPELNAF